MIGESEGAGVLPGAGGKRGMDSGQRVDPGSPGPGAAGRPGLAGAGIAAIGVAGAGIVGAAGVGPSRRFQTAKRAFDIAAACAALPVLAGVAAALLVLNPLFNPGPLLYRQRRMGRSCRPFEILKFRTMRPVARLERGPDDPLERERITPLGHFLRRTRLDELPQFVNVLRGEMSVIGPRPDYWDHARLYLEVVPGYRERHRMRPGITGLAQVDLGYAQGLDATLEKTRLDLRYIAEAGPALDLYILRRTIAVVLSGDGT